MNAVQRRVGQAQAAGKTALDTPMAMLIVQQLHMHYDYNRQDACSAELNTTPMMHMHSEES